MQQRAGAQTVTYEVQAAYTALCKTLEERTCSSVFGSRCAGHAVLAGCARICLTGLCRRHLLRTGTNQSRADFHQTLASVREVSHTVRAVPFTILHEDTTCSYYLPFGASTTARVWADRILSSDNEADNTVLIVAHTLQS